MLAIHDLHHRYAGTADGFVLAGVELRISEREFVCVIGPSGCGKSTLLSLLAGFERPNAGTILLDGESITGPGVERGLVPQSYSLFPWRTVAENVRFGLDMRKLPRQRARELADEFVGLVGLREHADHFPRQLSGGQKQRVAIARALANQPRMLLMDEPFSALDSQTRRSMQQHLLRLWTSIALTICFVTHDLDEAILLADRIVVLSRRPGRIREIVPVPLPRPRSFEQLFSEPARITRARLEALVHDD